MSEIIQIWSDVRKSCSEIVRFRRTKLAISRSFAAIFSQIEKFKSKELLPFRGENRKRKKWCLTGTSFNHISARARCFRVLQD